MATVARVPRSVKRVLAILVAAAVVEIFVLPELAGARKSAHLLADVNPLLLALGVALEVAALCAYFQLTRSLVPPESRPSMLKMARIELSTLAVNHVMPGGAGPAGALGYRLLGEAGVAPDDAGFALATQGLGSALVLNAVLWVALIVSIPAQGVQPLYTTAAIVGVVLFGLAALLVVGLTKAEGGTARFLCRVAGHVPLLDASRVENVVHGVSDRLRTFGSHPRLLWRSAGWALANWMLDAASLWVFVAAFGHRPNIDGLLVAYGLANVLAALPITPGGLGIVEGVLTPTLVGFGVPGGVAVLGVVSWRLVNFWIPIPAGGLAYLSLRLEPHERSGRRTATLGEAMAEAASAAEPPTAWARRRGLRVPRRIPGARVEAGGQEGPAVDREAG